MEPIIWTQLGKKKCRDKGGVFISGDKKYTNMVLKEDPCNGFHYIFPHHMQEQKQFICTHWNVFSTSSVD